MTIAVQGPGPVLEIGREAEQRPRLLGKALSASQVSSFKMRRPVSTDSCSKTHSRIDGRYGTMLQPKRLQTPTPCKSAAVPSAPSRTAKTQPTQSKITDGGRIGDLLGRHAAVKNSADHRRRVKTQQPISSSMNRAASAGRLRPGMPHKVPKEATPNCANGGMQKSWSTPSLDGSTTIGHTTNWGDAAITRSNNVDNSGVMTLRAGDLFDQLIQRDRTYGHVLQEIKDAYEVYLGERGLPLPTAFVPATWAAMETRDHSEDVGSLQTAFRPSASPEVGTTGMLESAVDAARRPWHKAEDDTYRGEFVKMRELEQENEALRALVQHLKTGSSAGVNGSRLGGDIPVGAGINMARQRLISQPHPLSGGTNMPPRQVGTSAESTWYHRDPLESTRSDTSAGSTLPWVSDEPLHHPRQISQERRPQLIPELDLSNIAELLADDDGESDNDEYIDDGEDDGF